jgi:hypothetical protein
VRHNALERHEAAIGEQLVIALGKALVERLASEQLGRHPEDGAARLRLALVLELAQLRKAKIGDLAAAIRVEEEIGGLEVAVNDFGDVVKPGEAESDIFGDADALVERERRVGLEKRVERAARHELSDNHDAVRLGACAEKENDREVIDLAHNGDLGTKLGELLFGDFVLVERHLDSDDLTATEATIDLAKDTTTNKIFLLIKYDIGGIQLGSATDLGGALIQRRQQDRRWLLKLHRRRCGIKCTRWRLLHRRTDLLKQGLLCGGLRFEDRSQVVRVKERSTARSHCVRCC